MRKQLAGCSGSLGVDSLPLPNVLILGVPLVLIVPALVEGAKQLGLPAKWAGVAAIAACGFVLGLVELQAHDETATLATWALGSLVYGLAAAGLYSQAKKLSELLPGGQHDRVDGGAAEVSQPGQV